MKKTIIFLIIVAALGGALYFFWPLFKSLFINSSTTDIQPVPQPKVEETNYLKTLVSRPIFNYWFLGGEVYYLTAAGEIFRISAEGTHRRADSPEIIDVDSINSFKPSFDRKSVLITFSDVADNNNPILLVFNTETNSWLPVDKNVVSAAWHPSQNQIVYLKSDTNVLSLKMITLATQKTTEVIKLNMEDVILEWVTPDEIYISEKPSSLLAGSVWALNISKKTLRPVVKDEYGLMVQWAEDGKTALKFTSRRGENKIEFIDLNNTTLSAVGLSLTLPSKCVFEGVIIYCAVSRNIPDNIILPDDYLKLKFYSEDDFWSWNTETGETKLIFDFKNESIDAEKIDKNGSKLFFINRYTGSLNSLEIEN